MDKYQEALDKFKSYHVGEVNINDKVVETLQELVDLHTPTPLFRNEVVKQCPRCKRVIANKNVIKPTMHYCPKCGQKLDWSCEND